MKLNGIFGTGSGKTGNAVFATSAGKQIVRTYQPKVSNPKTDAQIAQRAKFKLLSQLAAAMGPVIAIAKDGLTSARNLFVKINSSLLTYSDDTASVKYEKLQITNGVQAFPAMDITFGEVTEDFRQVHVELVSRVFGLFNRVVYSIFAKTDDNKLSLLESVIVNVDENNTNAEHTFEEYYEGEYVIYAYGMKDKSAAATLKYENYSVEDGTDVATLVNNRTLTKADTTLSETIGDTFTVVLT